MSAPSRTTSALIVALGVALGAFFGLRGEPWREPEGAAQLNPAKLVQPALVAGHTESTD